MLACWCQAKLNLVSAPLYCTKVTNSFVVSKFLHCSTSRTRLDLIENADFWFTLFKFNFDQSRMFVIRDVSRSMPASFLFRGCVFGGRKYASSARYLRLLCFTGQGSWCIFCQGCSLVSDTHSSAAFYFKRLGFNITLAHCNDFMYRLLSIYVWRPIIVTLANRVDPDQPPQNAASDQGLPCLH